ncbi:hypothetical protein LVJ94_37665 [Pendulispora rubella]|uniref:Copper type II ascorbate-dependent monooxygenase C-terminal domain-containing protein n=1 Tax=Pendulispora rubella TaxID=2741070 RepID=A0ABZ2KVC6_9BACT
MLDNVARIRLAYFAVVVAAVVSSVGCKRAPTYHRDVAPIVTRRCIRCHAGDDASAPPRLDTYESVVGAAPKIKYTVQRRMMPPWGADDTGICRTWRDALWLDNAELSTLVAWTEGGTPEGDPVGRAHVQPDSVPELAHVEASLDLGFDYKPGLGPTSYRCFVVDPNLDRDRFLTGIRVRFSNPQMLAQVTLFAPQTIAAEAEAIKLDQDDPAAGYSCYGSPRVDPATLVSSWTWSTPAQIFPAGTGIRLAAHRKLVAQVHYNVLNAGLNASSRTAIDLQFDDNVREATYLPLAARAMQLAPGKTYAESSAEMTVTAPSTVFGVAPRMHSLGRTMQLDRFRGASPSCVGNFDHWDFYRQRLFTYDVPLRLDAGDRLRVSCIYNTEGRAEPVLQGESIRDEECAAYLYMPSP